MKQKQYKIFEELSKCKWLKELVIPYCFDTVSAKPLTEKAYCKNVGEQFINSFVWDCETYWDDERAAVVFACSLSPTSSSDTPVVFEGLECIQNMVKYIDSLYEKKQQFYRNHVYVWAHNSKGFDSYIVLQTTGLKFKNIVKNGGNIL